MRPRAVPRQPREHRVERLGLEVHEHAAGVKQIDARRQEPDKIGLQHVGGDKMVRRVLGVDRPRPVGLDQIESEKENGSMTKTLNVEGMMCGHCEARVKKALEAVEGVASAEVSHEKGTAVVTLSKDVPDAVLKKAVEDQDYAVTAVK